MDSPRDKRQLGQVTNIEDLVRGDIVEAIPDCLEGPIRVLVVKVHTNNLGPSFGYLDLAGKVWFRWKQQVRLLALANEPNSNLDAQLPRFLDHKHPEYEELRFDIPGLFHGRHDHSELSKQLLGRLQALGISKKTDRICGKADDLAMSGAQDGMAEQSQPATASRAALLGQSNKIEIGDIVEVKRHGGTSCKGILIRKILLQDVEDRIAEVGKRIKNEFHPENEENRAQNQHSGVPSIHQETEATNGTSVAPVTSYGVGDIVKLRTSDSYVFGQIVDNYSASRLSVDTGGRLGLWHPSLATLVLKAPPAGPKFISMAFETTVTKDEDEDEDGDEEELIFVGRERKGRLPVRRGQ